MYWNFQLFGRHRYRRLTFEKIAGKSFVIMPSVFNPRIFRSGEFMAQHLNSQLIPSGTTILDMGRAVGLVRSGPVSGPTGWLPSTLILRRFVVPESMFYSTGWKIELKSEKGISLIHSGVSGSMSCFSILLFFPENPATP